jgi:predicted RNA-binding Zn-ribbon protein involved in translation (DUF1610 family)
MTSETRLMSALHDLPAGNAEPAASAPQPAAKVLSPIKLPCPLCGEEDADISVHLANLGSGEEFMCDDCGEDFSIAEVRRFIARWTPILDWLSAIPTTPPDAE